MTIIRRPGPNMKDGIKRETFSFTADPRLVAEAEKLVDFMRFRNRSEVIEEGLRLVLALHGQQNSERNNAA